MTHTKQLIYSPIVPSTLAKHPLIPQMEKINKTMKSWCLSLSWKYETGKIVIIIHFTSM